MKAFVILLVVVLALTVESAFRGKSHKAQKAVKDEETTEPGDDGEDDGEWPNPPEIKSFSTDGEFSAHGGYEAGDRAKIRHGKAGRKSHSH